MPPDDITSRFENDCSKFNFLKCNTTTNTGEEASENDSWDRSAGNSLRRAFATARSKDTKIAPRLATAAARASRLPGKFLIKFRETRVYRAGSRAASTVVVVVKRRLYNHGQ